MGRLLLERTGGEWRRRHTLLRLGGQVLHDELSVTAPLKERLGKFTRRKTPIEFGTYFASLGIHEYGRDTITLFVAEVLYLTLAFDDKTHGHTLYTAGTERGFHLAPQHGTQLETHDAIEHTACLLGIDQIQVDVAGMFDGVQDGLLRNLMEHDAACMGRLQMEHFRKVPADGLSLAVFIGCQPDGGCLARGFFQLSHHLHLVRRDFVLRGERVYIYTEGMFLQVSNVSITGEHSVILAKKLLNRLRLSGTLHDNQILFHCND